jgi:hypothetical protein
MAQDGKLIEKPKSVFCFPGAGLTTAHMASAVLATMEIEFAAFPADRDLAATGVVVAAFRQKFPCRR